MKDMDRAIGEIGDAMLESGGVVRLSITLPAALVQLVDGVVAENCRSRFLGLAALLALSKSVKMRSAYRNAISELLKG